VYNSCGLTVRRTRIDYTNEYRAKLISAEDAAGLVTSGMWVDYGYKLGFPQLIDEKLAERASELQKVKIRAALVECEPHVLKADPEQEHFVYSSFHLSAFERRYHDRGLCSYIPSNLGDIPRMYREEMQERPDIAFVQTTPIDGDGWFNFGASISYEKALCDAAKTVVLEVCASQPWVQGGRDEAIHISEVDHVVENTAHPLVVLPDPPVTRADEAMAGHIVSLMENGSNIEIGIGAIPTAIANLLLHSGLKDLGVHSGSITDGVVDLINAGVVTCARKTLHPGKVVLTTLHGTRKLYDFVDRNPMVAGFCCDYTHNVNVIAQNANQVCINNALRVDLRGQVCSESAGTRQISGTGGQVDWIRGANASPGGKAITCLYSTYVDRKGQTRSNIVPLLEHGDMVTVPATEVSWIVTEYGAVNLRGRTTWQRAKLLISIAHPDFGAELQEAAERINVATKGTRALGAAG
jgi:acyl-CoA hydrolase